MHVDLGVHPEDASANRVSRHLVPLEVVAENFALLTTDADILTPIHSHLDEHEAVSLEVRVLLAHRDHDSRINVLMNGEELARGVEEEDLLGDSFCDIKDDDLVQDRHLEQIVSKTDLATFLVFDHGQVRIEGHFLQDSLEQVRLILIED